MNIPSLFEAESMIGDAENLNPGPWVAHSRFVAQAARLIAAEHPCLDTEAAAILGLLHDIGRREGMKGMRHVLDGYRFLLIHGFEDAARISLTHSYPTKIAAEGSSMWDGTREEFNFVQAYLDQIEYTPYDRLIQLCDSLAFPGSFCLLEQRLVDVVMRYGFNEFTLPKWRAFFQIKKDFEQEIGGSIYSLLPGVVSDSIQIDGEVSR